MVLELSPPEIPILQFDSATKLQKESLNFKELVIHSKLRQFEKRVENSGLSVKMAVSGTEHYQFQGTQVFTDPHHFIIANEHDQFDCHIESQEEVEAFCLYLDPQSLYAAIDARVQSTEKLLEKNGPLTSSLPAFPIYQHSLNNHGFGQYLQGVKKQLLGNTEGIKEEVFFTELTEQLAGYYLSFYEKLEAIPSKKQSTKLELLRRLEMAYDYIQANYHQAIQLDELARVATLSKFHLLRTFRSVYQVTPYQLVLHLRLEKAKDLLSKGVVIEDIAFQLGFSDRRSFTKAFRRHYLQSPSAFRTRNCQ